MTETIRLKRRMVYLGSVWDVSASFPWACGIMVGAVVEGDLTSQLETREGNTRVLQPLLKARPL